MSYPSTINFPLSTNLGRNPTERLLKIHQALAAQRFPNTFRLAKEFEVSQKTIKHDVQWMKNHRDLPIAYNRSRHPTDNSQDCLGTTVHLKVGGLYNISYYLGTDGSTLNTGAAMWVVIGTSFGIDLSQDVMLTAFYANSPDALPYQKFLLRRANFFLVVRPKSIPRGKLSKPYNHVVLYG